MSRSLGDLYGVATAVTRVGSAFLSQQHEALCKHVLTSSLLNPTPIVTTHDYSMEHAPKEHGGSTPHHTEGSTLDHNVAPLKVESVAPTTAAPEYFAGEAAPVPPVNKATTNTVATEYKPSPVEQSQATVAAAADLFAAETNKDVFEAVAEETTPRKLLKESRIPTTRIGRLWHYGTLATGLGIGAVNESIKRATGLSQNTQGSAMLSERNVDLLVDKISRMRGAALKMGQMLSIQGIQAAGDSESWIPPQMEQILLKVHDSANYMPRRQMEKVMANELGSDWRSSFSKFDPIPIAAASIGQVHAATLASTGQDVVVKIQYPGVADAIDSDLNNLKAIVTFSNLLPRGLYLDNTIKVAKQELAWECDYQREAANTVRFGQLVANDARYKVPDVIQELCTQRVLTLGRLRGQVLSKAVEEPQDLRNKLGENLLRLCLREVFTFQFMQTDPNWSNFFYNRQTGQIELLDFGACREFGDDFLSLYGQILKAAARGDRDGVWTYSEKLGFVTGYETAVMREAHIDSVMVLGEPFRQNAPDKFDFATQTITGRVRDTIPVMLRHRLTPPPDETYGLHKKLSGAFLLCTKLRSQFDTKKVWYEEVEKMAL